MDRDRDRDSRRLRDVPPEDQFMGGRGQSYRPGGDRPRSPPRSDNYRARSPPRREREREPVVDSYAPSRGPTRGRSRSPPRGDSYRRRSPSPRGYRDAPRGADSYRARPRSPPRREELPRDDLFRREPPRDYREDDRYARRSPPRYRDRSPLPLKRGREPSLDSRGRRTPPPSKRERLASPPRGRYDDYSRPPSPPRRGYSPGPRDRRPSPPRGVTRDYRLRSRSPLARNDRIDPRAVDDWRRPRSPSPPRAGRGDYHGAEESGRASVVSSRRSSPPVHPSRLALRQPAADDRGRGQDSYETREPYRARSPVPRSPPRRRDSPPPRERDPYANGDSRVPPPREPYRSEDVPPPRAPPIGPGGYRAQPPSGPSAMSPPSGPAAAAPMSMSAHARASIPTAPSGPRGGGAPRGDFAARGRGGFSDFRGGRGGFGGGFRGDFAPRGRGGGFGRGGFGRGETFERQPSYGAEADYTAAPPSGPRGSFSQASAGPPFRQGSNTTATTYPRTMKFAPNGQPIPETPTGPRAARDSNPSTNNNNTANERRVSAQQPHPALADLPKIVDGGVRAESVVDRSRAEKLEEEAERLRKVIEEKQARKRRGLREWERLGRESEVAGLRSELAEASVSTLAGEVDLGAAF